MTAAIPAVRDEPEPPPLEEASPSPASPPPAIWGNWQLRLDGMIEALNRPTFFDGAALLRRLRELEKGPDEAAQAWWDSLPLPAQDAVLAADKEKKARDAMVGKIRYAWLPIGTKLPLDEHTAKRFDLEAP